MCEIDSGQGSLKPPAEGGTKQQYQEFIDKIDDYVSMEWPHGADLAYFVREGEEPKDLGEGETREWKKRLWNKSVEIYGDRVAALEDNKQALYSLLMPNISKMMKTKIASKSAMMMPKLRRMLNG